MRINKIKDKLDFEVEAQDSCTHGYLRLFETCSKDCLENRVWVNATTSLMKLEGEWGEYFRESCTLVDVYGCATMHLL